MKKIQITFVIVAAAIGLAAAVSGCRSVEVENYGEEVVRDADDKPVTLADGRIQTIKKGWRVDHFQHWMITEADSITASIRPESIDFALNGLNTRPDGTNLVALVDTSFKGATELAAKIGAAIASSGGSVGVEAAASALASKFLASGGNAEKAAVTVADGVVTCTDGSCTVSGACADCTP